MVSRMMTLLTTIACWTRPRSRFSCRASIRGETGGVGNSGGDPDRVSRFAAGGDCAHRRLHRPDRSSRSGPAKASGAACWKRCLSSSGSTTTKEPLYEALPDLVPKHPDRYRDMTLKELSDEMHAAMGELNLPNLLQEACDVEPEPVMTPAETYQKLIRNGTEKVRAAEMAGRMAARDAGSLPAGNSDAHAGRAAGRCDSPTIRFLLAIGEVWQAVSRV